MPLDSSAVACLKFELSDKIIDGRIEKVYQPEKDEICILIRKNPQNFRLLISADTSNPRMHITENTKENPLSAPMFCMLLRKHLTSGRIVSINQPDFERIIDISIESYNELHDLTTKHIYVELMGRHSNIILADENGKIIDSAKHVDITVSSLRNVLPGLTYTYPPSQNKLNPLKVNLEEIKNVLLPLCGDTKIEKALLKLFTGVSPLAGREISFRSTGDIDSVLNLENANKVSKEFLKFYDNIKDNIFSPVIITDKSGKTLDFSAFNVSYFGNLAEIKAHSTISEAMDDFYYTRDKQERMRQRAAALHKSVSNILDRFRKKLVIQQEKLAEVANKDLYKIYGEIITANLYRIKGGENSITLENFYNDNSLIEIPLDEHKSPSKNAQIYFTKYRKAKTAEKIVSEQLRLNLNEIDYMESVLQSVESAENETELAQIRLELVDGGYIKQEKVNKKVKQKPIVASPMLFKTSEGFEILVGKNNKQNDYLTLKTARANDLWFHVKNIPGSHVVIRKTSENIPDSVIEKAFNLAAYYSKGKNGSQIPVDYTEVKNVKKPSGAKPGMVIYENYKTAYVTPSSEFLKEI